MPAPATGTALATAEPEVDLGTHAAPHADAEPEPAPRRTRPGLILLGISGGLVPSPSAFLVLVTGLFTGRSGFALALVITFGLGLATVLFGVGLLALAGRNVVARAVESPRVLLVASRVGPVLAAATITLIGVAIVVAAVDGLLG